MLIKCQQLINNIFVKSLNVFIIVCLNDIIIYLKILEKYMRHIKIIFSKFLSRKFITKGKNIISINIK